MRWNDIKHNLFIYCYFPERSKAKRKQQTSLGKHLIISSVMISSDFPQLKGWSKTFWGEKESKRNYHQIFLLASQLSKCQSDKLHAVHIEHFKEFTQLKQFYRLVRHVRFARDRTVYPPLL